MRRVYLVYQSDQGRQIDYSVATLECPIRLARTVTMFPGAE